MEIYNSTVEEYLQLEDNQRAEYDFFMRYSTMLNRPDDRFMVGDMMERSFGLVKDLQHDIGEGMDWNGIIGYVMQLTGKQYPTVAGYHLDYFCQGWRYIQEEITRISEIEAMTLAYIPTDEEVRAGINSLGVLGVYLQFRSIATALGYTIDQVKAMRYDEAFLELTTQKLLSEYEAELSRIRIAARK